MSRSIYAALLLSLGLLAGCAARFSPEVIRDELARQRGIDPRTAFELSLGRVSTRLLEAALDDDVEGGLSLVGLERLELAVFEIPGAQSPALDVRRLSLRGWEPAVRFLDPTRSGIVLTRTCGDALADMVLVGSGTDMVVYARLRGELNPELPHALGETLRSDGPRAVQDMLNSLMTDE